MAEAKKSKEKQLKEAELIAEAAPLAVEGEAAPVAKAGKKSAKALKEGEAKQAKQERKHTKTEAEANPKEIKKPTRTKAERAGKKYREAVKQVEVGKEYELKEALSLAVKTSTTKFDSTVELHINLGVDPRQADQNIRGIVVLPSGTGKTARIAVLAEGDDAAKAKTAGADIAGVDEVLALLDKEDIHFDVLISTPALMAKLGKYARLLGPKGLMPNPKSGTVTNDIATAIKDAKAGRVEYRVDQAGIVHLSVGKVSFGPDKLLLNAEAVLLAIRAAKPASLKGVYIKSTFVTTSMGPSVKIASAR
ncbi:MAG: 50S ribosomal protein L1 [Candidatus Saccharimonadales bacterium]